MEPATSEDIDAVRDMVNRFMQTEVCYKIADRHHGKTGSRDIRRNDVVAETN